MKLILLSTFLLGMVTSFLANASQTVAAAVGATAPDFELDSTDGKIQLSEYFHKGKITVLVFSRASWCPFCLRQLIEFRRNVEAFEQANVEILFVFREESKGIDGLKTIQARAKSDFTLALDNEKTNTSLYSPADNEYSTYVIDETGTIQDVFKGDLRYRVKSRRILDAVDALTTVTA